MPEYLLSQALRKHDNFDFFFFAPAREATIIYHERSIRATLSGITMEIKPGSQNPGLLEVNAIGRCHNTRGRSYTDPVRFTIGENGETQVFRAATELETPNLVNILKVGFKIFEAFDRYPEGINFGPYRMQADMVPILGSSSFQDYRITGSVGSDRRITLPYQGILAGFRAPSAANKAAKISA